MILIWGWRTRFKTILQGVFFCPTCGADRGYERKQGRQWFTFFFIPLIPLKHVGEEFVECITCRSAFKLSVLQQPTSADLSELLVVTTRQALAQLLRVSAPTAATLSVAGGVLSQATNRQWTEDEVRYDVANFSGDQLDGRLATLSTMLSEQGKETFFRQCAHVAAADGAIAGQAQQVLDQIAAWLGITPAHARGVLVELNQPSGF